MPHLAPGRNATSTSTQNVAEESVIETPSSLPIMADHLEPRHTEHHQKSEQIYVNISHVNLTVPSLPASNEVFTTTVRPTIIIYPTGRHRIQNIQFSKKNEIFAPQIWAISNIGHFLE